MGGGGRYGHGAAMFKGYIYIYGGYASNGRSITAQKDMWRLPVTKAGEWEEVMTASERPRYPSD